jgi:hypothetical protein
VAAACDKKAEGRGRKPNGQGGEDPQRAAGSCQQIRTAPHAVTWKIQLARKSSGLAKTTRAPTMESVISAMLAASSGVLADLHGSFAIASISVISVMGWIRRSRTYRSSSPVLAS